jgi:NADPH:quinone reductase-like Zn-dependent oxidoreductase
LAGGTTVGTEAYHLHSGDESGRRTMKAIVQDAYGSADVMHLREIKRPRVGEGDVLVRVRAAALNAGDYFTMRGVPTTVRLVVGLGRPRQDFVPGCDLAGRVAAVGKNVMRLQKGDEVFGSCSGTCAEYACAKEDKFVPKPVNLTFEQAAAVPTAAATALRGLRDAGKLQAGQMVLINGASGGVGTFAVQIAKWLGAEVTGVCSTGNTALVRSLGADHVIDYTKEDFTLSGQRYDLILDNVGGHSFSDYRRALTANGRLLPNTANAGMGYVIEALVLSALLRRQARPFLGTPTNKDLVVLKGLLESGVVTPIVDRTYSLSETPQAIGYIGAGHARGKVVITL